MRKQQSSERRRKLTEKLTQGRDLLKQQKKKEALERQSRKRKQNEGDAQANISKKKKRVNEWTISRLNLRPVPVGVMTKFNLDQAAVLGMYDPKADGHCGWRAASVILNGTEQEWPLVKVCMDAILKKHSEFYRYGLRVEYDDLLRMLSHQTEGVGVFSNNYFETLDCPRLLAEAYNRPVNLNGNIGQFVKMSIAVYFV
ncbi:hypothetical protein BJV82DRAFT_581107 [Fennellomyces sp. T-0311]|nr:hypothetical protein BJV82DRAFT_581107 [Fennellomyces sp. T-0311]